MRTPHRGPVLFAGGGTVGHLAPGLAVAAALGERGIRTRFATPGGPEERDWFGPDAPERCSLPAARRPRRVVEVPAFAGRFAGSLLRAVRVLQRERPSAVVALGGWPCVPAALAARALRVPLFFLASDHRAGVVVRRLGRLADRVYVAHASAAAGIQGARVVVSGPVLRAEIGRGRRDPGAFGLEAGRRTLFVVGGSLGAQGMNERVLRAIEHVGRAEPSLLARVQVLHSTGPRGEAIGAAYERLGVVHRAVPFVRDMACAWATSDLALSRAGAITCAELEATGTPSVLVPYPHHADRQQFENARPLVERGGAVLLEEADLTPEAFRDRVLGLLLDEDRLRRMRAAAGARGRTGTDRVVADLVRWIEGEEPASYGSSGLPEDGTEPA